MNRVYGYVTCQSGSSIFYFYTTQFWSMRELNCSCYSGWVGTMTLWPSHLSSATKTIILQKTCHFPRSTIILKKTPLLPQKYNPRWTILSLNGHHSPSNKTIIHQKMPSFPIKYHNLTNRTNPNMCHHSQQAPPSAKKHSRKHHKFFKITFSNLNHYPFKNTITPQHHNSQQIPLFPQKHYHSSKNTIIPSKNTIRSLCDDSIWGNAKPGTLSWSWGFAAGLEQQSSVSLWSASAAGSPSLTHSA